MGRIELGLAAASLAATAVIVSGAATDLPSPESFRVRSLAFPYTSGAVFVMPHEKVPLALTSMPHRLLSLEAPQGALTATGPNTWTWEAPGEKGRYPLEQPAGIGVMQIDVEVVRKDELHTT